MATIQLTTTNYNGESGNVYFWPCNTNGNASFLGTQTFPFEIVDTNNYEGTYEIGFTGLTSGVGQICYVQIPCSGCNRPTGLTQTDLYVTYSDGVNSVAFTGSTFDVCTAANNLNNNVWSVGGSLSSQIGPDNTVYKTAILGDCATIEDGYYILLENGVYVARQISGGILGSPIDCNILPTDTPTPTPAGPTATPTPTPVLSYKTIQLSNPQSTQNDACGLLSGLTKYIDINWTITNGLVIYNDSSLTTKTHNSNPGGYSLIIDNGVKYVVTFDGSGNVDTVVDCNSVPTPTPNATSTPTPTPFSATSTPSPTPFSPTDTPTPTPDATATPTPTGAPTGTPTPTPFAATATPSPTPQPPQTYPVQIATGVGGPSGTACQNAQSLNGMFTVYSLYDNVGQLSTSTEILYNDSNGTSPFNGNSSVYSDGTVYGTINSSGVFVYQGNCSGI
jgi:hypothetical protein